MFDIKKRNAFQTVGELRSMINRLPANTRVCICGDINCFYHEEVNGSLICLDCEDLGDVYKKDLEEILAKEPPSERDKHLESLWAELTDVTIIPSTEFIAEPFYFFPEDSYREDIWQWFDQHHSKGVAYLLNSSAPAIETKKKTSGRRKSQ